MSHPRTVHPKAPVTAPLKHLLLAGTALCSVASMALPVFAGTLPTMGAGSATSSEPTAGGGAVSFVTAATKTDLGAATSGATAPTYAVSADGNTGTVNLSGARTIINWDSFKVGTSSSSTETVNFLFPTTSASNIVVNRVNTGSIDVYGTVTGGSGGSDRSGNLWFLSNGGVFFHDGSTVAAGGVLAGTADLVVDFTSFLSSSSIDPSTLLDNAHSLINLTGTVQASGVSVGSDGTITLSGASTAGASGAMMIAADNTVTQSGGSLTASTLSASSVGGMDLSKANQVTTVTSLTNSGANNVSYNSDDAAGVTILSVTNHVGNTTLKSTSGDIAIGSGGVSDNATGTIDIEAAGALSLGGDLSSSDATLVANGGSITQSAGTINAASLSATASHDISLTGANLVPTVDSLKAVGGTGDITYNSAETSPTTVNTATSAGGSISVTAAGELDLPTDTALHLISAATDLTLSAVGALDIGDQTKVTAGGNVSLTGTSFLDNTLAMTAGHDLTIHDTASSGGLDLSLIPLTAARNIRVTVDNGDLTAKSLTGGAGSVTAIATNGNAGVGTASAGTTLTLTGKTASIGTGTSSGDLTVTGTGGDISLSGHATSSAGSVVLSADGEVNVTGGISAAHNYAVTGNSFSAGALTGPSFGGDLFIHDNDGATGLDLHTTPLTAPGSVTVIVDNGALTLGSVTAHGGNVAATASNGGASVASAAATGDVTVQANGASGGDAILGSVALTGGGSAHTVGVFSADGSAILGGDSGSAAGSVTGDAAHPTTVNLTASSGTDAGNVTVNLIGISNANLGTLSASKGKVAASVSTGDISVSSATAGNGNVDISAPAGAATLTTGTATGGHLTVSGDTANLGSGTADNDVTVTGTAGDITVITQAKSNNGSVLLSSGGQVNVSSGATIDANLDYSATGHSFSAKALSPTEGRDFILHDTDPTTGLSLGTVSGARNASVTADHGDVTVSSITGGTGNATVIASSGAATVSGGSAGGDVSVQATGNAILRDVTLTGAAPTHAVAVSSSGASATLGANAGLPGSGTGNVTGASGLTTVNLSASGTSAGDVTVNLAGMSNASVGTLSAPKGKVSAAVTSGAITVTSATAGAGNLTVSGDTASLDTGTASGDLTVTGATGDAKVTTTASAGGDVAIHSTGSSGGDAILRDVTLTGSGNHTVDVSSTGGSVTLGADATSPAAGGVTGASGTTTTINLSSSALNPGDVTVNLASISNAVFGTISSLDGSISVSTDSGDAAVTLATAENAIHINATTGQASLGSGTATTGALTVSGKTASLGSATAAGDLSVTGTGGDISVTGAVQSTGGSVSLSAAGLVNVTDTARISSSLDYSVSGFSFSPDALSGPSFTHDLTIHDTDASSGLDLSSTPLIAPHSVTITADNGDLTVGSVTGTTGSVTVTAGQGAATVTSASAGADITVQANGLATGDAILRGATLTDTASTHTVTISSVGGSATLGADPGQPAGSLTDVSGHTTVNMSASSSTFADIKVNLASVSNASFGTLNAPAGSVSVTATSGDVSIGTAMAGHGDIDITATGGDATLTTGTASAGGHLSLTGVTATLGSGTADGDITVTGAGGGVNLISLAHSSSGSIVLSADGAVDVHSGATVSAAFIYSVTGHSFSPDAITGPTYGLDLSIHDTDSTSGLDLHTTPLSAPRNVFVTVDNGSLTLGSVTGTGGNVVVTASNGNASLSSGTADGGDLGVSAVKGAANLTSGSASALIDVSGKSATLGSGTAGGSVTVTGTAGDAEVTTSASSGGDVTVQATGTSGGDAILRDVALTGGAATHTVTVSSAAGSATLGAAAGVSPPAGTVTGVSGSTTTVIVSTTADPTDVTVNLASVSNANLGTLSAANGNVSVTIGSGDVSIASASAGGGDVAINMQGGSVSLGGATAGDDVVIRATGDVTATGDIKSGQTIGSIGPGDTGSTGPGDVLATALPMTIFGASAGSQTAGYNVNILAQHVSTTANIEAGTSGDTSSHGAGSQALVVASGPDSGLASLRVGDVSANQDIGLDATNATGRVNGADLTAGRDVAVRSSSGNVDLGAVAAGDDVVLRAPAGQVALVIGGTTSGQTQRGQAFDDSSSGLADKLESVVPLSIFGASVSVAGGHDIDISGATVDVSGGAATAGTASPSINAPGDLDQDNSSVWIVATGDGGLGHLSLITAAVNANQDIGLDATGTNGGIASTSNALVAGRDVAVRSSNGSLFLANVSAGDDVVLRATTGDISTIALTSGQAQRGVSQANANGLGDTLTGASAISLFGAVAPDATAGYDISVRGVHVSVTGTVEAGTSADTSAAGAASQVQFVATGADSGGSALKLADVKANQDIGLDATNATGSVTAGALTAGRDAAVRSSSQSISLGAVAAGDDVVLRAAGTVTADAVTSGQTQRGISVASTAGLGDQLVSIAPMTIFGQSVNSVSQGYDINVVGLRVDVSGAIEAGSANDVSLGGSAAQALIVATGADSGSSALSVGAVSANQDIGLDATAGSIAAAALLAGNDVAVRSSTSTIDLTSATAGDDVVLRAPARFIAVTTTLSSGQSVRGQTPGDGGAGKGDTLAALLPMTIFGSSSALSNGLNVDVVAAQVTVTGATTAGTASPATNVAAQDNSDARIVATGAGTSGVSLSVADVSANRDVGLDATGTTGGVSAGATIAGRDAAVHSTSGAVGLTSVAAGDDVVLRAASGAITVSGTLASGTAQRGAALDDANPGVGDVLAGTDNTATVHIFSQTMNAVSGGHDVNVAGLQVSSGAITAGGTIPGSGDPDYAKQVGSNARIVALGSGTPAISLTTVSANEDVGLEAQATSADVSATSLTAGRDVAVRSVSGAVSVSSAAAGDDVVLRATSGQVTVNGGLTSGQVQNTAPFDDTAGLGDQLRSIAPMTIFGSSSGTSVSGGHDVDVMGLRVGITGAAVAGTDTPATNATGDVQANQLGSDVRIFANGAGVSGTSLSLGSAGANGDVGLNATGSGGGISSGALVAGSDVAVESANGKVTLASAAAGDDVVLRGDTNDVVVSGNLASGMVQRGISLADGTGLGDQLIGLVPMTIFSGSVSTVAGGYDINVAGQHVTVSGSIEAGTSGDTSAAGAASQALLSTNAADSSGSALNLLDASANQDIGLEARNGGSVSARTLIAGGDVAVRSTTAAIGLTSATAGDDVVLRAPAGVITTTSLVSGTAQRGEALDDPSTGAGDVLSGADNTATIQLFGQTMNAVTGGHDVNLAGLQVSSVAITAGGTIPASNIDPDYSAQVGSNAKIVALGSGTPAISLTSVSANQDIGLDANASSADVSATTLMAGRDVAVRSGSGAIALTVAAAGDDVVLRATAGQITVTSLTSGQVQNTAPFDDAAGLADRLIGISAMPIFGGSVTSVAGGHDLNAVGLQITVRGSSEAGTSGDTSTAGAGSQAMFVATGTGAGALTFQDNASVPQTVGANQDIGLESGGGIVAGALTAGRDVAAHASSGAITTGSTGNTDGAIAAGDDVVLRASGQITVNGTVASGQAQRGEALDDSASGAGDGLAADVAMTLFGATPSLVSSHDVSLDAAQVKVTHAIEAGTSGDTTTAGAGSSVFAVATGTDSSGAALNLQNVSANADVGLDTNGGGSVSATVLTAGDDTAVRSTASTIGLTSAAAGDDVVLRAPAGAITVSSTLASGTAQRGEAIGDSTGLGDTLAGADITATVQIFGEAMNAVTGGHDVNVAGLQVSSGAITAGGAIPVSSGDADYTAQVGSSAKIVALGGGAPAISLTTVSANQDIGLDANAASADVSATALTAGRDAAVRSGSGAISLTSAVAGDDVVLRAASGQITVTGGVTSGQVQNTAPFDDTAGLGDQLTTVMPTTIFTSTGTALTSLANGHDIDVVGGAVAISGAVEAGTASPGANATADLANQSGSDVRIVAVGAGTGGVALSTASVSANGDVGLDATGANGGVIAGDLTSGRDVAVNSTHGSISVGQIAAGDDAVLRATNGNVAVTANLTSGHDQRGMASSDNAGVGDQLTTDIPTPIFGASISSVAGGYDISAVGLNVRVKGVTEAGNAGDTSTAGAGSRATLVATGADGGAPALLLQDDLGVDQAVSANQDVGLDATAGSVEAGAVTAGRDLAVRSSTSTISLASIAAGDDVVLRAPSGQITVTGAVTSGQAQRGEAFDNTTGLGDTLASLLPMTIFSSSGTALTSVSVGHDVDVVGTRVTIGGAAEAGDASPATDLADQLASDVRIVATGAGASGVSISTGTVGANEDVGLDATGSAGGITTLALTAGRDVAARSSQATIITGTSGHSDGSVGAADDVVLRASGQIAVNGTVGSGQTQRGIAAADASGLGDQLVTVLPMTVSGTSFNLAGEDIDVISGDTITLTGQGTATGAASDLRLQAAGAIGVQGATAGQDILFDGSASGAGDVTAAGALQAGRDVGVRAKQGAVSLASAGAGDDLVVRASGNIVVGGALTTTGTDSSASGQSGEILLAADPTTLKSNLDLTGSNIDVKSDGGSINVVGATSAATDARLQTAKSTGGAVTVTAVTAGQDILLDGTTATASDALHASRDIALRGRTGAVQTTSATAGDDIAIRAPTTVSTGALSSGTGSDGAGVADSLIDASESGPMTVSGTAFALGGGDIDVIAGTTITLGAQATASGSSSDVRLQAGGAVTVPDVSAGEDILFDGSASTSGDVTATGALQAGRDIGVRANAGAVSLASATAGDDIVLRASGAIGVGGDLTTTGTDSSATGQAGEILLGADPTSVKSDFDLAGSNIDVKSDGGSITVAGAVNAATDARLQTAKSTGGAVSVTAVTAGQDLLLDGSASSASNALVAGRDIALRSRSGGVQATTASAGDDIAIRATTTVSIGALTSGNGSDGSGVADNLIDAGESGPMTVSGTTFALGGGDIDVIAGSTIALGDQATAKGSTADVRLQAAGAITVASVTAGEDILADGSTSASGDVTASGALQAGRDIGVRATAGAASLASAQAGDDIVLRASRDIGVSGALTTTGSDSASTGQAGEILSAADASTLKGALDLSGSDIDLRSDGGAITASGAVNASGDARFQTAATNGGTVTVAGVTAGQDILADGTSTTAGALQAGRDVAVRGRSGAVQIVSASAGDDIAIRGATTVTAGALTSGTGSDASGLADNLIDASESGPITAFGLTFGLGGGGIDVKSSGAIAIGGAVQAKGSGSDARFASQGQVQVSDVTAGRDILADGPSVQTGALASGRDTAVVASAGDAKVGSASAGDNIAIAATGNVNAGRLAGGSADGSGVADAMVASGQPAAIIAATDPYAAAAVLGPAAGMVQVVAGGDLSLTGAASGGVVRLASAGNVSTTGLAASDGILVRANSLTDPANAWTATSIQIESTGSDGLALGDNTGVTGSPVAISNQGFGNLNAPTVSLYAGSTAATTHTASITVGALSVNDANVKALNLYAGNQGAVQITGVFAPSSTNAGASTALLIGAAPQPSNPGSASSSLNGTLTKSNDWAPGLIKVVRDSARGGSIGSAPGSDGLSFSTVYAFKSVELNSTGDILMGSSNFLTGLGSKSGGAVDGYAEAPGVLPVKGVLLAAGSLTMRANGRIVQQNTSLSGAGFTGMLVTGDGVSASNPGAAFSIGTVGAQGSFAVRLGRVDATTTTSNPALPNAVEMFLTLKDGTSVFQNTQVALSPRFGFYPGTGLSQFYRVNSCVIGQQGNCNPLSNMIINIQPDRLLQVLQLDQAEQPDVEDVTITGAANEEIWRRPE